MPFFKCCKNKEFSNLFCIVCHNVFHPSCLERKGYKLLQDYKVYCSTKCQELYMNTNTDSLLKQLNDKTIQLRKKTEDMENIEMENETIIEKMKTEIDTLKKELREREIYYNREKRRTLDFEDEVFRNEESFVSDINEKNCEISQLKQQLFELKKANNILEDNLNDDLEKMKSLEETIIVLNKKNDATIKSLNTIEKEKNELLKHINELQNLKINCKKNAPDVSNMAIASNSTEIEVCVDSSELHLSTKKILILGDENVKGFMRLLKIYTDYEYNIHSNCSRRATLREMVDFVLLLAKKFSKNDYIIFFWSANYSLQGKGVDCNLIKKMIAACQLTNLILLGTPFIEYRPILNRFVEEDCWTLSMLVAEMNLATVHFFPSPVYTKNGLLSYEHKVNIVRHLTNNMIHTTLFRKPRGQEIAG